MLVAKTDMLTGVFLTTIQPHNSTANRCHDTGRYIAWLICRVWRSRLFKCDDETEYGISIPIRSAAFLWASLRSGSRHIVFPDHLTGRCVLPYPSIPLQDGAVRYSTRTAVPITPFLGWLSVTSSLLPSSPSLMLQAEMFYTAKTTAYQCVLYRYLPMYHSLRCGRSGASRMLRNPEYGQLYMQTQGR